MVKGFHVIGPSLCHRETQQRVPWPFQILHLCIYNRISIFVPLPFGSKDRNCMRNGIAQHPFREHSQNFVSSPLHCLSGYIFLLTHRLLLAVVILVV